MRAVARAGDPEDHPLRRGGRSADLPGPRRPVGLHGRLHPRHPRGPGAHRGPQRQRRQERPVPTLSLQRAERIKTYLHEHYHLPKARMYTRGYGDTRPLAPNADEAGRRQNRRVEILMVDEVPASPDTAKAARK
ncbi:MAG: OmpA family protein [Candidatus Handelsmanbacteria bacterium]|nr:OmpA family protein [Candidatus Handelsmanbacteria bacterium]